jgi:hypothetical protein
VISRRRSGDQELNQISEPAEAPELMISCTRLLTGASGGLKAESSKLAGSWKLEAGSF